MAATTIGRESMTDGSTVWNVSRIGSAIYDRVDTILSSNITFGGVVSSEGFGAHTFSASGTGANIISVRNPTAGTSNQAAIQIGNDTSASALTIQTLSSTFTGANNVSQISAALAGGLRLICTHASGDMNFYTNTTARLTIAAGGTITAASAVVFSATATFSSSMYATPDTNGVTATGAGVTLIGATASCVELTSTNFVDVDVYGMTTDGVAGQVVTILNSDAGHTYTLYHESASALSAAQRFLLPGAANLTLSPGEAVVMIYSTTLSRWVACLG